MSEPWQQFAEYSDVASAEAAAGLLRSEGVPAEVVPEEPVPGLIQGFRLVVPKDMLHRARWVVSNATFTDEELAFFATGELSPNNSNEQ